MFPKTSKDKIRDYEKSMFAQTFTNFRVIITFISLKRFGAQRMCHIKIYTIQHFVLLMTFSSVKVF